MCNIRKFNTILTGRFSVGFYQAFVKGYFVGPYWNLLASSAWASAHKPQMLNSVSPFTGYRLDEWSEQRIVLEKREGGKLPLRLPPLTVPASPGCPPWGCRLGWSPACLPTRPQHAIGNTGLELSELSHLAFNKCPIRTSFSTAASLRTLSLF